MSFQFLALNKEIRLKAATLILVFMSGCAHGHSDQPAETPYSGSIIDLHAHVHFGDSRAKLSEEHPAGTESLFDLDAQAGVTKTALIVIATKGDLAATRELNDKVIAAARESGERAFPICSVHPEDGDAALEEMTRVQDRKSTRLNSSHANISYAVFCLK